MCAVKHSFDSGRKLSNEELRKVSDEFECGAFRRIESELGKLSYVIYPNSQLPLEILEGIRERIASFSAPEDKTLETPDEEKSVIEYPTEASPPSLERVFGLAGISRGSSEKDFLADPFFDPLERSFADIFGESFDPMENFSWDSFDEEEVNFETPAGDHYAENPKDFFPFNQNPSVMVGEDEERLNIDGSQIRETDSYVFHHKEYECGGSTKLFPEQLSALAQRMECEVVLKREESGNWIYGLFFEREVLLDRFSILQEFGLIPEAPSAGGYVCRGRALSKEELSQLSQELGCPISSPRGEGDKTEYTLFITGDFVLNKEYRLNEKGLELILSDKERARLEEENLPF